MEGDGMIRPYSPTPKQRFYELPLKISLIAIENRPKYANLTAVSHVYPNKWTKFFAIMV